MDHRGGFHGYRKQQQQQQQHPKHTTATDDHQMNNHIHQNGGRSMLAVDQLMNQTPSNYNHHQHQHNNNNNNNVNMNGNNSSNMNNHNSSTDAHQDINNNECTVREQDRFMPIANVIRIMRKILPPHAKISDDAKETIQECVSEYISFITGEANERCQREQRKTITAEDVLWAMSKLGFDDYIEPLTLYLHRYRDLEGDRGSIRTCEPLLKMGRAAAMDHYATAFGPPVFHIGPPPHHHHPHHPGAGAYFLGPPPPSSSVNGYLQHNNNNNNNNNNDSNSAAANSAACCTSDAPPTAAAPTSLSGQF